MSHASDDWSKHAEEATLHGQESDFDAAIERFERGLSRNEQLALVSFLVRTRGRELCRAYEAVVNVRCGYAVRKEQLVRTPSVIFVVKRKVKSVHRDQRLPERLLCHWTVDGAMDLCAVPTDVECATRYSGVSPDSRGRQAFVSQPGLRTEKGMVACVVQRSAFPDQLFALSCLHVFGLTVQTLPEPAVGARVLDGSQTGAQVAVGRPQRGELRNQPETSFDAQLAEGERDPLRHHLNGLTFTGPKMFAEFREDYPDAYFIRTERGAVPANLKAFVPSQPIPYAGPGGTLQCAHDMLVESTVPPGAVRGGDSGSPVVTQPDGGMFLGMHIAGDGDDGGTVAYMIPAPHLLDAARYTVGHMAPGEALTLVNP